MTYQRVVNRNGLREGDYGKVPLGWRVRLNTDMPGLGTMDELISLQWPDLVRRAKEYERAIGALLGDLRRLERDTVDEGSIAAEIERRTGIDQDVVAAVLKEYIAL